MRRPRKSSDAKTASCSSSTGHTMRRFQQALGAVNHEGFLRAGFGPPEKRG